MARARPPRDPKPTDLLTVEDIAAMYGWPTERASTLMRSLGRRGLVTTFEGHRRFYISRQNLEGAIRNEVIASDETVWR